MSTTQVRTHTTSTHTHTTPTRPVPSTPVAAIQRRPVWRHGLVAAVAASATTTALAALASADGVSFSNGTDAGIPILGFAQLTMLFSLVGVGLAAVLARRGRRPRRTFVRTALALTALSFVPDLTFGFDRPSAVTLVILHTVASTIVVPTLAGRLARGH
jgi:hypothetical protein